MKWFILSFLIYSSHLLASPLNILVEDFNFDYQAPIGRGHAKTFSSTNLTDKEVEVFVEKIKDDFSVKVTGTEEGEFMLKGAPTFMTRAESMSISGLSLKLEQQASLSLKGGDFISPREKLLLRDVNLRCDRDTTSSDEIDQILLGCVDAMTFTASSFLSESLKGNLVQALFSSLIEAITEDKNIGISNVNLSINNSQYSLTGHVRADISGKVKSSGQITYNNKSGVLTLKISEVRFSLFNIKGRVFNELRKQDNARLEVKEPFVYYQLK